MAKHHDFLFSQNLQIEKSKATIEMGIWWEYVQILVVNVDNGQIINWMEPSGVVQVS